MPIRQELYGSRPARSATRCVIPRTNTQKPSRGATHRSIQSFTGKDGKAISSTAPAINLHLIARIRSQANSYLLHVVQKSSAPDDIVQTLLKEFPKAGDMPPFRRRIKVWQEIADFLGGDLGRWFSIIFIYPFFFLSAQFSN